MMWLMTNDSTLLQAQTLTLFGLDDGQPYEGQIFFDPSTEFGKRFLSNLDHTVKHGIMVGSYIPE